MNLFNSEQRRQKKEIERKIKARQAKREIERYVGKQRQNVKRFWDFAKRAARLQDNARFRQCAAMVLTSQREVTRWEQRLLYFDIVEARRDQVLAAAEFAKAYEAMAQSMLANANPQNMAKIQMDIERGLAQADMMDGMLENLMDMSEGMLEEMVGGDQETELKQIMDALKLEADQEAQGPSNEEIESSIKSIETILGMGK